jgi:hypothetical protein
VCEKRWRPEGTTDNIFSYGGLVGMVSINFDTRSEEYAEETNRLFNELKEI